MMDKWSEWILNKRFGGDKAYFNATMSQLGKVADKVIDGANLNVGETLLDVGCGDGLLGFRGLKKVSSLGTVIFSDISSDMVDHYIKIAEESGATNCEFIVNPVENLSDIADESVDAVVCRSVLIYTNEKEKAFREFFRVLKPVGRVSIFEPINKFSQNKGPKVSYFGYDLTPIEEIAKKVLVQFRGDATKPENHPMINFDEEDMLRFAENAGFQEVSFEYHASVTAKERQMPYDALLNSAMNPTVPTLIEGIKNTLNADEEKIFLDHLLAEYNKGSRRRYSGCISWLRRIRCD